ncbi:hypothetical protein M3Y97_00020500 [Aphelenchoides bicaudatus]|nr:hypothetical protein M3Y97_00020500 [Aphelenchoides bicaudatus]
MSNEARYSICEALLVRKLIQEDLLDENKVVVPASRYNEIGEKQFEIIEKIKQLRREGKWSTATLTPVEPPPRPKTHWDYLLEELAWVHKISKNERLARRFYTKKISGWVTKYHSTKAAEAAKHESDKNLEKEARKTCASVSRMIRDFWKDAKTLVELGQQEMIEAKKRADLDKQLSMLVEEADKLGKSVNANDSSHDEAESPKRNGKPNGFMSTESKPSSATEMEKFAEQAQNFKPTGKSFTLYFLFKFNNNSILGNTLETTDIQIKHPVLLEGQLREYQLIGLNWLCALYEKEMNGILADEMGLGKTIQTIGLLAHLAVEKSIWGPHLIVVPTSVILNWEMEFKKWCPSLKILTYFGSAKERMAKRKGWKKKGFFDVCITSYKLFTQDVRCFKQKQWQYLILDEAQHIKNFESQRWRSLINLRTRRRLLLTGTPLQNNLMELWSLLHFLMPTVFASRDDFKDWFNNPITEMIENNGDFNMAIVQRLHKVLRPFILRRLKCEVEKQLPKKTEKVIFCELSKRQRFLYNEFMGLRSTVENLQSGSIVSVLNIVMQLRKVCNHPNLFEPRQVQTPFCVEAEPFRRFCRQSFVNKNNEFEKCLLRLNGLDSTLKPSNLPSNLTANRSGDKILDGLRQELIDRRWTQNSLDRFGLYVVNVLYPKMQSPFYDALETWHDGFVERKNEAHVCQLHQQRSSLEEKALTNSMQLFPEIRLIEYDCGKLKTLAVLLRQLYAQKHRCLIFTQMSKMLDTLQIFLAHHRYTYFRLDGSTNIERRQSLMERFNSDSSIFCFILSTRAGGVGVNLIGADTVIFYDSDWNPTMDAQAQDRCHRIGQTRDVTIYRLISRSTIEENILKKAREKRRLGELTIDEAGFTPAFFKKTDNIRDLFYNEANAPVFDSIRIQANDEDFQKAMESVEDRQDALDAKEAVAEIVADEHEFEMPPVTSIFANEEFAQQVSELNPIQRYAVTFLASQIEENEEME